MPERPRRWPLLLLAAVLLLMLCPPAPTRAQTDPAGRIDVFVRTDPASSAASIYFLDALTGLSTVIRADNGHRFALVGDYVLYEKIQSGAIMRANLDGTLEPHPFIRRAVDTRVIRWTVSPDGAAVAWVRVSEAGDSEAFIAWADGRDLRQLPISSPAAPQELVPLALTDGMTDFFYDAAYEQGQRLYQTYAHVARYSIADEAFYPLPDEPNCPCAAAITANGRIFARLEAPGGAGPFGFHVWDLPTDAASIIPAPDLAYPLAGDLVLNESGTFAVYSAASEPTEGERQYSLVLVDGVTQQQYPVLPPGPERYRPLAFIDGDRALLLTEVPGGATYKLDLLERVLQPVSDLAYLGTITTAPE